VRVNRLRSASSIHPEQTPKAGAFRLEFLNATGQLVSGVIDRRHQPILVGVAGGPGQSEFLRPLLAA
jgi:hypothetical protein